MKTTANGAGTTSWLQQFSAEQERKSRRIERQKRICALDAHLYGLSNFGEGITDEYRAAFDELRELRAEEARDAAIDEELRGRDLAKARLEAMPARRSA